MAIDEDDDSYRTVGITLGILAVFLPFICCGCVVGLFNLMAHRQGHIQKIQEKP